MYGEAGRMVCDRARVLKALIPVAQDYGLKFYECAGCGSNLRLVTRVPKSLLPRRRRGRPPHGKRLNAIEERSV
jgi:hypothetical protein